MQLPLERKVGSKKLLPGNSSIKANFFEVPVLANFLKNTASACKTKYNSIRLKALSKELWNLFGHTPPMQVYQRCCRLAVS